ncbi:MAG: hypothetical protein R3F48_15125 [Candidatus Zixiibacteriota bacterium]
MSLTNISIIRSHLFRIKTGDESHRNVAIRLSSALSTQLPHTRLVSACEQVKAIEQVEPESEQVILADSSVSLAHKELAAGTVVCAADTSLSRVYREHIDFSVNYADGTVQRIDSGAIPFGTEVHVWYVYYHIYRRNIDYTIDYEKGTVRRLNAGDIEDGQELFIDYQTGDIDISDDEIEQCIKEAEAEMSILIDSKYANSIDSALQTASTCLALSYLARNTAGAVHTTASSTANGSNYWLNLAASYRETALRLLAWYKPASPSLNSPRKI